MEERSEATTRGVRVEVRCRYAPERSQPLKEQWFFLYRIRITNEGEVPVRLRSRHWIIQDALGEIHEVRGPGVVGEQPRLEPGQSFEYTSGCPLGTPFGSMRGTYRMTRDDGSEFDVEIAPFRLAQPNSLN